MVPMTSKAKYCSQSHKSNVDFERPKRLSNCSNKMSKTSSINGSYFREFEKEYSGATGVFSCLCRSSSRAVKIAGAEPPFVYGTKAS